MTELTDLEICKAIAKIGDFAERDFIEVEDEDWYMQQTDIDAHQNKLQMDISQIGITFIDFNPLKDRDLIFMLQCRYIVSAEFINSLGVWTFKAKNGGCATHKSPERALCLAMINGI